MKQIPNAFTLLNLVFGCVAIICILQPGETLAYIDGAMLYTSLPEKIWWGSVFIGIAALVDFLDGFVARLFKAESEMGKQLDSLADLVSFGVAPALIMYQLLRITFLADENAISQSVWVLAPVLLIPAAAAYRLARFNLDKSQSFGFKGVPVPAAGLLIASFPFIWLYNPLEINTVLLNKFTLYSIIIVVSALMVSTLPLLALKFKNFGLKDNLPQYILLLVALAAVLLLQWLSVPVIFIAYIVLSLATKKSPNKFQ